MFRHIRTKLAAVLAVPLVALVALAGVQVAGSVHQRSAVSSERALATASLGPAGVVSALQTERDEASLTLIGLQHSVALGVSSNAVAARQTDAAATQFRQTVSGSQAASDVYQPALADLGQLGSLRAASRSFTGDRSLTNRNAVQAANQLYARYTTVVNAVLDGTSRVAPSIKDQTLRSGAEILAASLRQTEAQTNVVHDVFVATFNGGLTAANGSLATTAADLGNYQAWTSRLQTLEVAPYASAVQTLVAPTSVTAFTSLVHSYLGGATPDLGRLLASTAAGGTPAQVAAYHAATRSVAATVTDRSSQLGRSANQQLEIYALIALLALALGAALVVGASRSIARPIIRLAGQASELADHRLASAVDRILRGDQPDETELPPIVVKGRDETAQLAGAIAAVQDSAVSLAVEQAGLRRNMADAFTNLGRRSQNLVTRQLDYITSVEKTEADPDQLEQLFRLDHLATRMRRNAESLLVLGGSTSPRQWSKPVPVIDAVRAALSEVEDFRRVRLGAIEPSATAGRAASDIAHIMAELIENALTNSSPQTPVRISGHNQADGYVLTVADDGLGMDAEGLARANERLSGHASFTDSPSRSLGHFVAGRLAVRHDISVELQPGDRGVRALVHLPVSVLPDRPASQPSSAVPPAASVLAAASAPRVASVPPAAVRPLVAVAPAAEEAVAEKAVAEAADAEETVAHGVPVTDGAPFAGRVPTAARVPNANRVPTVLRVPGAGRATAAGWVPAAIPVPASLPLPASIPVPGWTPATASEPIPDPEPGPVHAFNPAHDAAPAGETPAPESASVDAPPAPPALPARPGLTARPTSASPPAPEAPAPEAPAPEVPAPEAPAPETVSESRAPEARSESRAALAPRTPPVQPESPTARPLIAADPSSSAKGLLRRRRRTPEQPWDSGAAAAVTPQAPTSPAGQESDADFRSSVPDDLSSLTSVPAYELPREPVLKAAPAPVEDGRGADFESWLNSRLDQLEQMSLQQSVTATPVSGQPVANGSGSADASSDDQLGASVGGLPRRRPGTTLETSELLLRRRPPEPPQSAEGSEPSDEPAQPAQPVARVNSSLFRYLAAVDQRPNPSNQEGSQR